MKVIFRDHILIHQNRIDFLCYPCSAILNPASNDPEENTRNPNCTFLLDRGLVSPVPWCAVLFDYVVTENTTPEELRHLQRFGTMETAPDTIASVIFADGTPFAPEWEALRLAARMHQADDWAEEDCARLCELAGMLKQFQSAKPHLKDGITEKAAQILGVNIL